MKCVVCGTDCSVNSPYCSNCGCDLPINDAQRKIIEENKRLKDNLYNSSAPSALETASMALEAEHKKSQLIMFATRITLIATLLCFLLPFAKCTYSFMNDLVKTIGEAFGTEVEADYEEVTVSMSGFDLMYTKEIELANGFVTESGKNFNVTFSAILIAAALAVSFLNFSIEVKTKVMASLASTGLLLLLYFAFHTNSSYSHVSNSFGFYITIFLMFVAAVLSAFMKAINN